MILDTSFIIDLMLKEEAALRKLESLEQKRVPRLVTTPTIAELWSGLARSTQPKKEKEKIRSTLRNQLIIPLDGESARTAGLIDGTLVTKGERINPMDALIAGIALTKNQALLTRDDHFSRVKGLNVKTY